MFLHPHRQPQRWHVTDVPAAAGSIDRRPIDTAAPSADDDIRKLVDLQRIVTAINTTLTHLALDVSNIPDTAFLDTSYSSRAPPMPSLLLLYATPPHPFIAHAKSLTDRT